MPKPGQSPFSWEWVTGRFNGSFGGGNSLSSADVLLSAAGWLVIFGPVLAFPEVIPPTVRAPLVLVLAALSLGFAAMLLGKFSRLGWVLWPLAALVLLAWFRSPSSHQAMLMEAIVDRSPILAIDLSSEATQHLAGLALGLLAMSVTASVVQSPGRLVFGAVLYASGGAAVLLVGLMGTSDVFLSGVSAEGYERAKFFVLDLTNWIPQLGAGLPGLDLSGTAGDSRWVNPNALGAAALLVAPIGVTLCFVQIRQTVRGVLVRLVGAVSTIAAVFVLFVTQSRSAWLALSLVLVVLWIRSWRRFFLSLLLLLVVVMIGVGYTSTSQRNAVAQPDPSRCCVYHGCVSPQLRTGPLEAVITMSSLSASNRLAYWTSALAELANSPWLGIGINQFHAVDASPPSPAAHAHNIFIQVALDLGVIGLLLYGALLAVLLMRADRLARDYSGVAAQIGSAAGLVLVGVHAFGLGDAVVLGARIGLFQWLAAGLIIGAWYTREFRAMDGEILGPAGKRKAANS